MAGPSCSVLTSAPCSPEEIIRQLALLCGEMNGPDGFLIRDTRPIGGHYEGDFRPFVWSLEPIEPDECAAIANAFGFVPLQEIGLGAMANDQIDHQVLGEMALWLAERTHGVVDLCGNAADSQALPGKIARIPYETIAGRQAEYVVMDREAFRAWLARPAFVMVK